jgi:hypothetical protein
MPLILKKTGSHYGLPWDDNDYVVLDAGQIIGRVLWTHAAPQGSGRLSRGVRNRRMTVDTRQVANKRCPISNFAGTVNGNCRPSPVSLCRSSA